MQDKKHEQPPSTSTSMSSPSNGNGDGDGNGDAEQETRNVVRFASMDVVHNLARRVSAGFSHASSSNSDADGGGVGGIGGTSRSAEDTGTEPEYSIEQQSVQHQQLAGDMNDSRSFFVDGNLANELHQAKQAHSAAPQSQPISPTAATKRKAKKLKASSPFAGHTNSVIVWRNLKSTGTSPRGYYGGGEGGGHNKYKKERTPASRLPMRYRKLVSTMLVLTAVATEFIGISISLPVLISYATSFGVPERLTGLVFSVSGFSTFLSNLWIPVRSDRVGRKSIIVATLCGSFVAYILEASAPSFEVLLLGLFLGGLFGGTQPVAVAYISDIYSPAERPRFIGMVPACASVCFTMGPALGGYLSSATDSYRAPLIFASVVVAAFLPVMIYYLPESRDILSKAEREEILKLESQQPEQQEGEMPYEHRTTFASASISPATFLSESSPLVKTVTKRVYPGPVRDIRCYGILFIELFRTLAFSGFVTTLPLVLGDPTFGLKSDQEIVLWTGIIVGVSSAVKSIGLFVLFDRIQKRIGLVETMVLGSMCGVVAFLILMCSGKQSISLLAVGFSIFCFGSSMVQPGVFAFVTMIVPHGWLARAVAMPNLATALGQTIAPIAGSAILSNTSYRILFFIGLILMATQLLLSMTFLVKRREIEDEDETVITDSEEEEEDEDGDDTEGLPLDEYSHLLQSTLMKILAERNYDLRNGKAQKIVLDIVNKSFPYLRDDESDRDRDLDKLCNELSIMQGGKKNRESNELRQQRDIRVLRSSMAAW